MGKYTYDYPMPSITCDIIVIRQTFNKTGGVINEVLLIKRKNEPFKDCWALPGGFMEINETLETCARRELKEETNIDANDIYFKKMLDKVDRDPRGRVVSAVFVTYVTQHVEAKANDDAKELAWFNINELPQNMAFDHKELFQTIIK
jgi:8-oxo-dGTP diphosphatase